MAEFEKVINYKTTKKVMEGLSTNNMRNSLELLMDIARCAICLETVRLDVAQCVNDHLFCVECKGDLKVCPTCREPFSEVRPSRFVFQVIEALPHRCRHKDCGYYLEPHDDHEKFCGFKETGCKIDNCEWVGPGGSILQHIRNQHPNIHVFSGTEGKMTFTTGSSGAKAHFDRNKSYVCFTPFSSNGIFFWKKTINDPDKKSFLKIFYVVPNGKPNEDIYVKVVFTSNGPEFISKIKLHVEPDANCGEENVVSIPWSSLPHFVNDDKLVYSISVTTS